MHTLLFQGEFVTATTENSIDTPDKAMERLQDLNASLVKRKWPNKLTEEEWDELCDLAGRFPLPCRLGCAAYGFVLTVHEVGVIHGEETPGIIALEHHQFPFPSAQKGFAGQAASLEMIAKITHTTRNRELLEWHGFNPLNADPTSYQY